MNELLTTIDDLFFNTNTPKHRMRHLALALIAATGLLPAATWAGTDTWDGGGASAVWNTANNWGDNTKPLSTDDVVLDNSLTTLPSAIGLDNAQPANSLTFGSANGTALGAFTLQANTSGTSGRTLTLTTGNITVHSSVTGTITLGTSGNGILTLACAAGAAGFTVVNNTSQMLDIVAKLSGASKNLSLNGGTIRLGGANSDITAITGAATIGDTITGTLVIANSTKALSSFSGITISSGSALDLNGVNVGNSKFTVNGTGISGGGVLLNGTGTATVGTSGSIAINTASTIKNSGTSLSLICPITYTGELTLTGSGSYTIGNGSSGGAGGVVIDGATVAAANVAAFGTGPLRITSNGGTITGAYALNSSALTIQSSTVTFGASGNNGPTFGATTLDMSGTSLTVTLGGDTGARTTTLGALGNTGAAKTITVAGLGTLRLSAAASGLSSGTKFVVNSGNTLTAGNATALGTSPVIWNGGTVIFQVGGAVPQLLDGSGNAGAGAVTISGSYSLTIGDSSNLDTTINGNLVATSSSSSLIKDGTGTLTLNADNKSGGLTSGYNGAITVSAGTLKVGNAGALGYGTSTVTVNSGAVLDLNSYTLTSTKPLNISGTGISNGGAIINSSGTAASAPCQVVIGSDGTTFGGSGDFTLGTGLSTGLKVGANGDSTYGITKIGSGTVTLPGGATATAAYTFTISDGTLVCGAPANGGVLTSGTLAGNMPTVNLGAGTLKGTGDKSFKSRGDQTLSANINQTGGALTLANTASTDFGGNLAYSSGTLTVDRTSDGTGNTYTMRTLSIGGVTLTPVASNFSSAPTLVFGATALSGSPTFNTVNMNISLGALSDDTTARTITVSGGANTLALTAAAGSLTAGTKYVVSSGNTLQADNATALGTSPVIWNGGTFKANANITVPQILNGAGAAGASDVNLVSGTLTIGDGSNYDTTITGTVSGGGALTKGGTGTLTLNAANSYSGITTVSAGKLLVNNSSSSSSISVSTGATLGGHGSVTSVGGDGLVSPGNSAGVLTCTHVSPASGLDFAFEFGGTGSPTYGNAAASGNDVLRITAATPFAASMTSGNVVDVYLNVETLSNGAVFKGGFYTDNGSAFDNSISGATYRYWVLGNGGGSHNGYYTLAELYPALGVVVSTVQENADFGGGTVNGYVTKFTVATCGAVYKIR